MPDSVIQLRRELERATTEAIELSEERARLMAKLRELVTNLPTNGDLEPKLPALRSCFDSLAALVSDERKEHQRLTAAWKLAATRIDECFRLSMAAVHDDVHAVTQDRLRSILQSFLSGLDACETWDALREQARAEGLAWEPLPDGVTPEQLPEAVAARQIETQYALARLAAPRLLRGRLTEALQGTAKVLTEPDNILSPADWETLCTATNENGESAALRGIATRRCLEHGSAHVLDSLVNEHANSSSTLIVISFLSHSQIDDWWNRCPSARVQIQLALLRGLLLTQRAEYWFWAPLRVTVDTSHHAATTWDAILAQLSTWTLRRNGFARLTNIVGEIVADLEQTPHDAEQTRQDLLSHLEKPLSCSDGSRMRLRQFAHRRLWPPLRDAVKAQDVTRAAAIVHEVEERDLDELYEQWAAEFNLSTRSLRTHFREDIEEILGLANTWCRALQPVSGSNEEQVLRALLRECLDHGRSVEVTRILTPEDAHAFFGRSLPRWVRAVSGARLSADFPASDQLIFTQPLPASISVDPLQWRTWCDLVEKGEATFGTWATDLLNEWAGVTGAEVVVDQMLASGKIEAARQAADALDAKGITVPDPIRGRIDAATDELRQALATDVERLRADLARLRPADRAALEAEMPNPPEQLTQSATQRFGAELAALRQLAEQTFGDYDRQKRRDELVEQLRLLEREAPQDASIEDLEAAWQTAWDETASRRGHLKPLRAFHSTLRQIGQTALAQLAERALVAIGATRSWSRVKNGSDLELYVDHLLLVLLEPAWQQAENWLPERLQALTHLTEVWLSAMAQPDWLTDANSLWWGALRHCGNLNRLQPDDLLRHLGEIGVIASAPATEPEPQPVADVIVPPPAAPALPPPVRRPLASSLQALRAFVEPNLTTPLAEPLVPSELRQAFSEQRWEDAAELAGGELLRIENRNEASARYANELLIDSAAAMCLAAPDETIATEVSGPLLHGINAMPDCAVRTAGTTERLRKDRIAELFGLCFFDAWGAEFDLREPDREAIAKRFRAYARVVSSAPLPERLSRWLSEIFRPCSENPSVSCPILDAAWSALPKDDSDSAVRGWLLWNCLDLGNWPALRRLLFRSTDVMNDDQAEYFRLLLDDRERNSTRFETFLGDLRVRSAKRPVFLNFSERLLQARRAVGAGVKVTLMDTLQKQPDGQTWLGQIHIAPPELDPPASLTLTLPESGPLRFVPNNGTIKVVDGGPFLHATEQYCEFSVIGGSVPVISLDVRCSGSTLTERAFDVAEHWEARLRHDPFLSVPPEVIDEAFLDFDNRPVSGEDYVPRPWDEEALSRLLFEKGQSVWMRSPRRSGKSSILLRLIALHGCRADRPTGHALIHVDLSNWNYTVKTLSAFIWEELWGNIRNAALARCFEAGAEDASEPLTQHANLQRFLQEFAEFLVAHCPHRLEGVYFLFDEADRLRDMHHAADERARELSRVLLWQVRSLIQVTRNVGVLFASVSSTDRLFAERADSPFFNSIKRHELRPFSLDGDELAHASLAILHPEPLHAVFATLPRDSAEHMIRLTRGVPYYMRLVAGATFAAARSRTISRSDVNRGVQLLLQRALPGVFRDLTTLPGVDELSVLETADPPHRRVLAKGVLLAAAELLTGLDHPYLLRNDLFRAERPLKAEARLSDSLIRDGLELLLELNFLAVPSQKPLSLEFTIPILGESLRVSFHTRWNEIIHELEKIAATGVLPAAAAPSSAAVDIEPAGLRSQVEQTLLHAIDATGKDGRLKAADATDLLQREFPGTPVERQLGYVKLGDLLRSLLPIALDGPPGAEYLRRATNADLWTRAVQLILERINQWEQRGDEYTAGVLGNHLREAFGPGKPIYERLGYARLLDFVEAIPEISVHGTGVHHVLRRVGAVGPEPEFAPQTEGPRFAEVEAFLRQLLSGAEAQDRPLTAVYAGQRLRQRFPGARPVHVELGFRRLTDLISAIDSLRVEEHGVAHHIVRAVSERAVP